MRKICKLNGIKKILTLFTLLILITVPVGGEPNMISKITVGSNNNSINYPASRNQHVMAYDSESDRIILFGGWDPSKSSSQYLMILGPMILILTAGKI